MCGPAAPITCDNVQRGDEIIELTKHVDCVLGCFCAQGYFRNNYNGKCVPESECRNTDTVDISPHIPGQSNQTDCEANGCHGSSSERCGRKGCGTQSINITVESGQHENDCGPDGCSYKGEYPLTFLICCICLKIQSCQR